MGAKPSSVNLIKNLPIQPLPGSYGAPVRRKGHLTVYTDNDVLYIKLCPNMTVEQLKSYVKEKTGKLTKVYYKNNQLLEPQTLEELGINEFAMIKASVETLDTESLLFSDSSKSGKSYVLKDHSKASTPELYMREYSKSSIPEYSVREASKASTPENLRSLSYINNMDLDLSIYSVPDIGVLSDKATNKLKLLGTIKETEE
jgi:hypothetical protein